MPMLMESGAAVVSRTAGADLELDLDAFAASPTEIEQLRIFVTKVEEAKATMQAEEELGEIPEEFLGKITSAICLHYLID